MANKYEFNIEDINSVIITDISDPNKYSITCNRIMDDEGNFTTMFSETYSAEEDRSSNNLIGIMCKRCGTWNFCNYKDYEIFKEDNFENMCPDCNDEREIVYSEDHLIEILLPYFKEEEFFNVMIFINGKLIE